MANMRGAAAPQEDAKSALEQYGINLTEIARAASSTRSSGATPRSGGSARC